MRRAKEEGTKLWPLYKARCADLRALKKLERKNQSVLAALKAENAALRARAEAAEKEAEVAVRRRTELQELLDKAKARTERGDLDQFGSSTAEEGSSVAFRGIGRGRGLAGRR